MKTYDKLLKMSKGRANYFCLLDPDKLEDDRASETAEVCEENGADGILVGGSFMINNNFEINIRKIKNAVDIPVIIFPGLFNCISGYADAIFYLSLISSRNPQMLIGEQVKAAPLVKHFNLETIGTGYMLIESGNGTSVQYLSNSFPIPRIKNDIAVAHALAAEYLGMKIIYMDSGSGAKYSIDSRMIKAVKENITIPLVIGGGIQKPEEAEDKARAGADFIVTGNILEQNSDPRLIKEFAAAIHGVKR